VTLGVASWQATAALTGKVADRADLY
jgi:hypothetical protein